MRNKSQSKRIEDAQIMFKGLTENKESLSNRGITDQYIENFKALTDLCVTQNGEQEQLKAALKDLTQKLNDNMDQLDKEMQFCKRGVMTDMPKTLWKAFGFIYRRKKKSNKEPENPPDENPTDKAVTQKEAVQKEKK